MARKAVKKTTPAKGEKPGGKKPRSPRRKTRPGSGKQSPATRGIQLLRQIRRWSLRAGLAALALAVLMVLFYAVVNPYITPYMVRESHRLGEIDKIWVPLEEVAPVMARSVVAAEDANFCLHWGFDAAAIRAALAQGAARGGSTISQQVVKNVYLWQGRSWVRKGLEALLTPLVELGWSKRRIIEVYLNIAEFDEGVFGVDAAAHHYFGVSPSDLNARQAAALAMVLPGPKSRSASRPTRRQRARMAAIRDGAALIERDGRAGCFEP